MKIWVYGWLILSLLLVGCGGKDSREKIVFDTENLKITEVESKIYSEIDAKECYLCGNREDSLMSVYGSRDSVGIVHINTMSILESGVRYFDERGRELFGLGDNRMNITFLGKGYGSVIIQGNSDRGYSEISIQITDKDIANLNYVKSKLCQECLDQVCSFCSLQEEYGKKEWVGSTGYCLIDFKTRKLYSLADVVTELKFRDYVVKLERKEKDEGLNLELFVVYAPIREKYGGGKTRKFLWQSVVKRKYDAGSI